MTIEPETWKRLIAFVERRIGPDQDLCPATELFGDLGFDGDEAFDFLEAFSHEFSVGTGDFDFGRYFGSEGFSPLGLLHSVLRRQQPKHRLTLSMLAKAAELGTWQTMTIETSDRSIRD